MRSIPIFFVLYFQIFNLFSQPSMPVEPIDSVFESIQVSDNDWVISLSIEQAGTIYDSLGNMSSKTPQGTFLLLKIGGDHFLQKIWFEYPDQIFEKKIVFGKRLKLDKNISFDYSADSILLANKEWIYPFIYKSDTDSAYNVLEPSDHEPYYAMHFKTVKIEGSEKFFTETSLSKSKVFLSNENLNHLYNSGTFVYRSLIKMLSLIKGNMKAIDMR